MISHFKMRGLMEEVDDAVIETREIEKTKRENENERERKDYY